MGGKVARIKGDLDDLDALLEIMNILKDVATNRFYTFAQRKINFQGYLESFFLFFDALGRVETNSPLIRNDNPKTDIVVVCSDQGFMGQLNSRTSYVAMLEFQKQTNASIICVGRRGADRCKQLGMNVGKVLVYSDFPSRSELVLSLKDFLLERIIKGEIGKVLLVHLWAKNFNLIKPRIVTLLPASELIGSQEAAEAAASAATTSAPAERSGPQKPVRFIQETSVDKTMTALADIWVHARLYETIHDIQLVEFATLAQQLESALEGLSSEKKGMMVSLKKASRDELNKAMREVFTSSSVVKRKQARAG